MKKLCVVSLALAVILSMTAFAQYSSKQPAQKDQATQAPLKTIEGTVKVEGDKTTFVADRPQPFFLQVGPERINVRNVEDEPPPMSYRIALLQIENRAIRITHAERRETPIFSAVDKLHPKKVPIEPYRGLHIRYPKGKGGNLFNVHLFLPGHSMRRHNPKCLGVHSLHRLTLFHPHHRARSAT
jgi:hypothetical protein